MKPVILDDNLRAKLNGLNEILPVCEPDGRTVGWYIPEEVYQRILMESAKAMFASDEATAARNEARDDYKSGRTRTTAEVIAYLESLPGSGDSCSCTTSADQKTPQLN